MIIRAVRHALTALLLLLVLLVLLILSPAILVATALLSLILDRHSWRYPRAFVMLLAYCAFGLITVAASFWLWGRAGFGTRLRTPEMQHRHYRLLAWMLGNLVRLGGSIMGIRVHIDGSAEAEEAIAMRERPILVLSRHAGPGDSFLLVNELLQRDRDLRVVLRAALQMEPCIDIFGNRLPFCFVDRSKTDSESIAERITLIASEMDGRGALLLFPEGGNFTPQRRIRAIRSLLRRGERRHARRAASMTNVIAPRTRGVLAALNGAPDTDVIFVAHSGLAGMHRPLLDRLPVDITLRTHLWLAPASTIPGDDSERTTWLLAWWERIDEWVAANPQAA